MTFEIDTHWKEWGIGIVFMRSFVGTGWALEFMFGPWSFTVEGGFD